MRLILRIPGDALVRFNSATAEVRRLRTTVNPGCNDEQAVRSAGFADLNEYWEAASSILMPARQFIFLLESHLYDPERTYDEIHRRRYPIARMLGKALKEVLADHGDCFVAPVNGSTNLTDYSVRPRQVFELFLRHPVYQDHLPESLKTFLVGAPRPRGRPTWIRLVEGEFHRRITTGEPTSSGELAMWFKKAHPTKEPMTEKTIRNHIAQWKKVNGPI